MARYSLGCKAIFSLFGKVLILLISLNSLLHDCGLQKIVRSLARTISSNLFNHAAN